MTDMLPLWVNVEKKYVLKAYGDITVSFAVLAIAIAEATK